MLQSICYIVDVDALTILIEEHMKIAKDLTQAAVILDEDTVEEYIGKITTCVKDVMGPDYTIDVRREGATAAVITVYKEFYGVRRTIDLICFNDDMVEALALFLREYFD